MSSNRKKRKDGSKQSRNINLPPLIVPPSAKQIPRGMFIASPYVASFVPPKAEKSKKKNTPSTSKRSTKSHHSRDLEDNSNVNRELLFMPSPKKSSPPKTLSPLKNRPQSTPIEIEPIDTRSLASKPKKKSHSVKQLKEQQELAMLYLPRPYSASSTPEPQKLMPINKNKSSSTNHLHPLNEKNGNTNLSQQQLKIIVSLNKIESVLKLDVLNDPLSQKTIVEELKKLLLLHKGNVTLYPRDESFQSFIDICNKILKMTNYKTSEEVRISLLELIDIIFSNTNVNDSILNAYVSKHFILTLLDELKMTASYESHMLTIILNHLYLKSQKLAHFIEIQVMHIITDAAYDDDDNTSLDIVMNIILFVDRLFITNNYMMTMNWIGIYKLIILFIKRSDLSFFQDCFLSLIEQFIIDNTLCTKLLIRALCKYWPLTKGDKEPLFFHLLTMCSQSLLIHNEFTDLTMEVVMKCIKKSFETNKHQGPQLVSDFLQFWFLDLLDKYPDDKKYIMYKADEIMTNHWSDLARNAALLILTKLQGLY